MSTAATTKFASDAHSTFRSETRNCVSIGFNSAKSSPPVRISSLNSSAFVMKNICTMLLMNIDVAMNTKN